MHLVIFRSSSCACCCSCKQAESYQNCKRQRTNGLESQPDLGSQVGAADMGAGLHRTRGHPVLGNLRGQNAFGRIHFGIKAILAWHGRRRAEGCVTPDITRPFDSDQASNAMVLKTHRSYGKGPVKASHDLLSLRHGEICTKHLKTMPSTRFWDPKGKSTVKRALEVDGC